MDQIKTVVGNLTEIFVSLLALGVILMLFRR